MGLQFINVFRIECIASSRGSRAMELRDRPTKTTPKQRIPQYTNSWQLRNAPVCYWGQLIGDVPLRIQSTYDVHCDSPATRNETTMFRCQEGPLQQKSMTSINLARSTAEEPERQSNALIIKGGWQGTHHAKMHQGQQCNPLCHMELAKSCPVQRESTLYKS